jgi:hypothetical protein
VKQLLGMPAPDGDSSGAQPKDATPAFDPRIQLGVPERAADKLGSRFFLNIQMNQAIARVTQSALEKAMVEAKEGWSIQGME